MIAPKGSPGQALCSVFSVNWRATRCCWLTHTHTLNAIAAPAVPETSTKDDAWGAVEDAFGFAGESVQAAADAYASDMEALGGWLSDVTGLEVFDDGATILAGITRGMGDSIGSAIASIPQLAEDAADYASNMSASDVLDGVQVALDVVGLVPVIGEIADGINGVVHLARSTPMQRSPSFR